MAKKRLHTSPVMKNRSLKIQREAVVRELEGVKSQHAKEASKELGTTLTEGKKVMELLKSDVLQTYENSIAFLNRQGISNLLSEGGTKIYSGEGHVPLDKKYPENPALQAFYGQMDYKVMESLTAKKAKSQEFLAKSVDIQNEFFYSFRSGQKNTRKFSDTISSMKYFKDDKFGYMSFDLETFGGQDKFGVQKLDMITEYSFSMFDSRGSSKPSNVIEGFIGIDEKVEKRHMELAERFRDMGSLTSEEQVAVKNYARYAHPDTLIDEDMATPGRFKLKAAGKYEDNEITSDIIKKGIKESKKVGDKQSATKGKDGLMTWQRDMVDAIESMSKEKYSITGHNINEADLKWMRQTVAGDEAIKGALLNRGADPTLNFSAERILDTLEVGRLAKEMPGKKGSIVYGPEHKEIFSKYSPLSQDGLGRVAAPEKYRNAGKLAHTAAFDTEVHREILNGDFKEGKSMYDLLSEKALKNIEDAKELGYSIKSNGDDTILYAQESFSKNVFTFKKRDNGEYATSDGYKIGKEKTERRYPETGVKKGVSYKINNVTALDGSEDFVKLAKEGKPSLAQDGLMMMEIEPVVDRRSMGTEGLSARNQEKIYVMGTQASLEKEMGGMIPYMKKLKNGKYEVIQEGMELLREKDRATGILGEAGLDEAKQIMKDGAAKLNNDPASRSARNDGYKRYKDLEDLTTSIESVSKATGKSKREILNNAKEGKVAWVQEAHEKDMKTIQAIFGNNHMEYGTQNNILTMIDQYDSIRPEAQTILNGIESAMPNASYDEKQFIFKNAMENLRVSAAESLQQGKKLDKSPIKTRAVDADKYEIYAGKMAKKASGSKVLGSMDELGDKDILTVNLKEGGEYNLLSQLKRFTGVDSDTTNLVRFGKVLEKDGAIKSSKDYATRLKSGDATPLSLANEIIGALKGKVKANPESGIVTEAMFHNILGASDIAEIPNSKELAEKSVQTALKSYTPGFIKKIKKGGQEEAVKQRRSLAEEIVDKYLMQGGSKDQLATDGYTTAQVKKLNFAKSARRKDYLKMADGIVNMVAEGGGNIILNEQEDIFGMNFGGEFYSLDNVPRDRYNGMHYTEIGGNKYSSIMIPKFDPVKGLEMQSSLGQAMDESYFSYGPRAIQRSVNEGGDPAEEILRIVKNVASPMREESSVGRLDAQDAKTQFMFNENGILKSLPHIESDILNSEHISQEDKEKLVKISQKSNLDIEKLPDPERQVYSKNRSAIYEIVTKDATIDQKEFLQGATGRGKSSAISRGNIQSDMAQYGFEAYNNPLRGIEASTNRTFGYRKDVADRQLQRSGASPYVTLGSSVRTKLGHAQFSTTSKGIETTIESEFVAKRAIMTSDEFIDEVARYRDAATTDKERQVADALLMRVHLTEGGAAIDGRVTDAIYQSSDEQRIKSTKKLLKEHYTNEKNIKDLNDLNKLVPVIEIGEDGKVDFRYQKGRIVGKGDPLLFIEGYGGKPEEVNAKYAGKLQFGYFSKKGGALAKEHEVLEAVKRLAKEKNVDIGDKETFMDLADQIFSSEFVLKDTVARSYVKLSEQGLEKHMTTALYGGLGDFDKRVGGFIGDLGLGDLKGKTLSLEEQEVLTSKSKFMGSALRESTGNKASDREYDRAVRKHFGNAKSMERAIMEERYLPSDTMKEIFGKDISIISNSENIKHKNDAAPIMSAIDTMVKDEEHRLVKEAAGSGSPLSVEAASRLSRENIVQEIGSAFPGENGMSLSIDDNGKMILPETSAFDGSKIDVDTIRTAFDKRFGEGAYGKSLDTGSEGYASFSFMQDSNRLAGAGNIPRKVISKGPGGIGQKALTREDERILAVSKGIKFGERDEQAINLVRFNQGMIDQAHETLDEEAFSSGFGHAVNFENGKPVLKEELNGKPILGGYADAVKKRQFLQAGEAIVTPETAPSYLAGKVRDLGNLSGGPVGIESAEKAYSAQMNIMATRFNLGKMSKEELEGNGFAVKALSGIPTLDKGMEEWMSSGIPDNMIVDLSDSNLPKEMFESGEVPQYVAIGKTPFSKVGDEVVASAPLKKLNTMARVNETMKHTGDLTTDEYARELTKFRGAAKDLPDTIAQMVDSKTGLIKGISEVRMENSFQSRAALMNASKIAKTTGKEALEGIKVDGRSVSDLLNNGVDIGFKVLSREKFEEMGYYKDDYLEGLGINRDDMDTILKRGVPAISERFPLDYEGSVRATTLAMSDNVKGDMGIENAPDALAAKTDADGDSSNTIIPTIYKKDGKSYSTLDLEAYRYRAENGDEEAKKILATMQEGEALRKDMISAQYRNAFMLNDPIGKKLDRDTQAQLAEVGIANILSSDGSIYPSVERQLLAGEQTKYQGQYDEMQKLSVRNRALEIGEGSATAGAMDQARKELQENAEMNDSYLKRSISSMGDQAGDYEKGIRLHLSGMDDRAAYAAKIKQAAAGQVNLPILNIKKLSALADPSIMDNDEWALFSKSLESAGEGYLSPKHSSQEIVVNTGVLDDFIRSLRSASGSPQKGDQKGSALLEDWLVKHGSSRMGDAQAEKYGSAEEAARTAGKLWMRVFDSVDNKPAISGFMNNLGTFRNGTDATRLEQNFTAAQNDNSMKAVALEAAEGMKRVAARKKNIGEGAGEIAATRLATGYKAPSGPKLSDVTDTVGEIFAGSKIRGRDLAIGALGIAGAIMAVGFVGGNPSKSSERQAEEAAASEEHYDMPVLSDEGLEVFPGQGSKGYIININANTKKGRKYTEQAVQQAMSNSYNSTNINISMNTRDSSGNITDRNIEEIIRGSFN